MLSSLDAKIDLLHRQNQTLEALAETLFRQWFIEEELNQNLGSLCNVIGGFAFKSADFIENGIPIVKIKNISNNRVDLVDTQCVSEAISSSIDLKYRLFNGDIVMAMTGATIGKVGLVVLADSEYLLLNQRVAVLRSRYQYFLWFLLNFLNLEEDILILSNGAAQANISTMGIEMVKIPTITDKELKLKNDQLEPFFAKTIENQQQIQTLERLRDALLPKLMAGSVRVGHCGEGEV